MHSNYEPHNEYMKQIRIGCLGQWLMHIKDAMRRFVSGYSLSLQIIPQEALPIKLEASSFLASESGWTGGN